MSSVPFYRCSYLQSSEHFPEPPIAGQASAIGYVPDHATKSGKVTVFAILTRLLASMTGASDCPRIESRHQYLSVRSRQHCFGLSGTGTGFTDITGSSNIIYKLPSVVLFSCKVPRLLTEAIPRFAQQWQLTESWYPLQTALSSSVIS